MEPRRRRGWQRKRGVGCTSEKGVRERLRDCSTSACLSLPPSLPVEDEQEQGEGEGTDK